MSRPFQAKFPAKCPRCGGRIKPGDMVFFDDPSSKLAVHETCPSSSAPAREAASAPAPLAGPVAKPAAVARVERESASPSDKAGAWSVTYERTTYENAADPASPQVLVRIARLHIDSLAEALAIRDEIEERAKA